MAVRVGGRGLYEAPGGCAPPQKTGLPAARASRRTGAPTLRTADRAAREKPEFVRACAAPKKHLRFSEAVSLRRVRSGLRPKIAEAGERLTEENVPRRKQGSKYLSYR